MTEIKKTEVKATTKHTCGIIMPISANDECPADHWLEILGVLIDVGTSCGFDTKIVSQADDTSVIQRTIVQNVFKSDIVICDVSCKNPNVMFELGMRLAFDKATVIIKDDITGYSFDTGIIEHLEYPRDLRLGKMLKFKEDLKSKIESTFKKSKVEKYSMFLHNFGTFKVAKLDEKEVTTDNFILQSLKELQNQFEQFTRISTLQEKRNSTSDNKSFNKILAGKFLKDTIKEKHSLDINFNLQDRSHRLKLKTELMNNNDFMKYFENLESASYFITKELANFY